MLWEDRPLLRQLTPQLWSRLQSQEQLCTCQDMAIALFGLVLLLASHTKEMERSRAYHALGNKHTDLSPSCGDWSCLQIRSSHGPGATRGKSAKLSDCRFWKGLVTGLQPIQVTVPKQSCWHRDLTFLTAHPELLKGLYTWLQPFLAKEHENYWHRDVTGNLLLRRS